MKNVASRQSPQATFSTSDNGITKSAVIAEPARPAQLSPSKLLIIFRERCGAKALLVGAGMLDFQDAVDQLQKIALDQELVDHFGQDEIQAIMAHAFKTGGRSWIS